VIAPHPLARLRFTNCRVPLDQRIGAPGEGFKVAMRTLDVFRTSVAAAALGFGRRALDEALHRATTRPMFGQRLADFQLTQAKLAQMATTLDAASLLTYRAAWQRDLGRPVTKEAAMAKMSATEGAQQVIDAAVQLWGGLGDAEGRFPSDDFAEQARQALVNIVDVVRTAGGKPEHIVRMTWYVTDKREYLAASRDIGRAFREIVGAYNAAMTAVEVKALIEDRAKVEIEATALLPV